MFNKLVGFFILIILSHSQISMAQQEIVVSNPSFEDVPRMGRWMNFNINGWMDCGAIRFESESPPDIHPGNFWSVSTPPSHGKTYLGLVVRDNDSWEGLSQKLSAPIEAGVCYQFNIDLARSPQYKSQSRLTGKMTNYIQPAVLRVWGGSGFCYDKELLAESTAITHEDWRTYEFKIKSKFTHKFILIEAYYKTPTFLPYCGHLLLDNLSNIKEVPCNKEQQQDIAVVVPTKPNQSKLPPHKKGRVDKKKEEAIKEDIAVEEKPEKEKVLKDLDIKKIYKGKTIEIKNLYFEADQAKLNEDSHEVLDEIFDFLKKYPLVVIEIGGHTNGQPKHAYCDSLSTERAKSVYTYLVDKGIDEKKLTYKGYGKRRRIANDNTIEGRRKNQRVEIKILSVG
jgi:outer membrane protein OmpA-like peptidoglycan-associated protein